MFLRLSRVALIAGAAVLAGTLMLSGCAAAETTTPPEFAGPKAISPVKEGMRLEIQTDQSAYYAGHTIKVRVAVVNTTNKDISFTTPTSLVFDILYEEPRGPVVKQWSDGRSFAQVVTPHTLPVGGAISQALELAIVPTGDANLWAKLDTGTMVLDTDKVIVKIMP